MPGPSRATERLVGWLLPPAWREHVLGDLRERYTSRWRYMAEVFSVVPLVIISAIRRTTDPVVVLMEALTLYVSFLVGTWPLGPVGIAYFLLFYPLALATVIALLTLILADAYASPGHRTPLSPIRGAVLAIGITFLSQALLKTVSRAALPRLTTFIGGAIALVLLSTLRLLFPPLADLPRAVNGPAFWQRREFAPLRLRLLPKRPNTPLAYLAWVVVLALILLLAYRD